MLQNTMGIAWIVNNAVGCKGSMRALEGCAHVMRAGDGTKAGAYRPRGSKRVAHATSIATTVMMYLQ